MGSRMETEVTKGVSSYRRDRVLKGRRQSSVVSTGYTVGRTVGRLDGKVRGGRHSLPTHGPRLPYPHLHDTHGVKVRTGSFWRTFSETREKGTETDLPLRVPLELSVDDFYRLDYRTQGPCR